METRAHHVLIGAFALGVFVLGLLFSLWATKALSDRTWVEYQVVFREAVTGLSSGSVVQYNGIVIGEVRELSLDPADPGRVVAIIRVEAGTPVKTDTAARLAFIGLTGVAQIQLTGGSPESPLLLDKTPRGERPQIIAQESVFARLLASGEDITATASEVLLRLNLLLSDENVENFGKTLAHLDQVSGALAAERDEVTPLLRDARRAAERLDRVLSAAEGTMGGIERSVRALDASLPELLDQLDGTLTQIEALSKNANALVIENRGAVQEFSQSGLSQIAPTLAELRSLLRQLKRAAAKIEDSPSSALLGGPTPEEYTP